MNMIVYGMGSEGGIGILTMPAFLGGAHDDCRRTRAKHSEGAEGRAHLKAAGYRQKTSGCRRDNKG